MLSFNGNGTARDKMIVIDLIQSVIRNFDAFYQSGFTKGIRYQVAFLYFL